MKLPFKMIVETEIEKYRKETFWTKEPETLAWIRSFNSNDNFIDVGANIGIYSLYAKTVHPDLHVVAIEPMIYNFARLVENISANKIYIVPYFSAISNKTGYKMFYVKENNTGATGSQMEAALFQPTNVYPIAIVSVDYLIHSSVEVNHVKIDIDGHELDVINGMELTDKRYKSALVECGDDIIKQKIVTKFTKAGFTMDNFFNEQTNHSRVRRGEWPENIIFTRD